MSGDCCLLFIETHGGEEATVLKPARNRRFTKQENNTNRGRCDLILYSPLITALVLCLAKFFLKSYKMIVTYSSVKAENNIPLWLKPKGTKRVKLPLKLAKKNMN